MRLVRVGRSMDEGTHAKFKVNMEEAYCRPIAAGSTGLTMAKPIFLASRVCFCLPLSYVSTIYDVILVGAVNNNFLIFIIALEHHVYKKYIPKLRSYTLPLVS